MTKISKNTSSVRSFDYKSRDWKTWSCFILDTTPSGTNLARQGLWRGQYSYVYHIA
uniref:Uncharacterized protein n=1 Tax=Populus trichocarpa TaxID=3694 RepID=A0A3N7FF75_POPTR